MSPAQWINYIWTTYWACLMNRNMLYFPYFTWFVGHVAASKSNSGQYRINPSKAVHTLVQLLYGIDSIYWLNKMVGILQKILSSTTLLLRVQLNHNQHWWEYVISKSSVHLPPDKYDNHILGAVVLWHTFIVWNKYFIKYNYKIFDLLF